MNKLINTNNLSCIYEIRNLVNNNIYIGSTNNLMYRTNYHLSHLKKGTHYNMHLQAAWDKYGEDSFQIDILVLVPDQTRLFAVEQRFLDEWKPEYNVSKNAQVPTKRGQSLGMEHRRNISKSLMGKSRTDESKKKQSESRTGMHYSEEGKKKLTLSRIKRPNHVSTHTGLVSPDGIIYPVVINLCKFCREHSLTKGRIYDMYKGIKSQHKGWTLLKEGV